MEPKTSFQMHVLASLCGVQPWLRLLPLLAAATSATKNAPWWMYRSWPCTIVQPGLPGCDTRNVAPGNVKSVHALVSCTLLPCWASHMSPVTTCSRIHQRRSHRAAECAGPCLVGRNHVCATPRARKAAPKTCTALTSMTSWPARETSSPS